jgi:hypothetical protein
MATTDNIRFGRGRQRRPKAPTEDPIKDALQPSNAPPPAWMSDRSLLPKAPPKRLKKDDPDAPR